MPDNPFSAPNPVAGNSPLVLIQGVVGAVVGGIAGYFVFVWLCSMNLYAFMLPGAAVGLGCSLLSKSRSILLSIICGILGLVAATLGEWQTLWFLEDESLTYFVQHIHKSRGGFALLAVILNGAIAAWFARPTQ